MANEKTGNGKAKVSTEQVKAALTASKGFVSMAAVALGVDRRTIQRHVACTPELKDWISELRECNLDIAENALMAQIEKGNMTAIIYFLKTQGRERGYVERPAADPLGDLTDDELMAKVRDLVTQYDENDAV